MKTFASMVVGGVAGLAAVLVMFAYDAPTLAIFAVGFGVSFLVSTFYGLMTR